MSSKFPLDGYRGRTYVRVMQSITDRLDPYKNPFLRVQPDMVDLGWGDPKTIYAAIARGEIPTVKVGRKVLIPTAWVRRALQLDPEPEPVPRH